jgi:RNA polymerase-binding transcription factor DksA
MLPMTTAFKIQLSDDLKTAHASATQRMAALRDELLTLDSRGDLGDQNRTAIERRNLVANIVRTHEQMEEIEDAFRRIRNGSYGRCCDCEESIGERRLLVQPWLQRCLPCQDRWERVTAQFAFGREANVMPSVQGGV